VRTSSLSVFSGKWALVTGASSGIGESFAHILAGIRVNLVLTGRNTEKLVLLRNELIKTHGIKVEIIPIDLSDPTSSESIFSFCQIKEITIDILINNAGYAMRTQDEIQYPEKVSAMLQVMVISLTELCYRFGFPMKQRKSGWILNVSSIVGYIPAASTLTYCASKRYIIDYTKYLHYELNKEGISVTCLMPGPTQTNFSKNNTLPIPKKLLIFYITSDKVALQGLQALAKNKTIIITGGISKTMIYLSRLIPPVIIYKIQQFFWVKKRDRYC
jgi:short-subunit dehydrogenase